MPRDQVEDYNVAAAGGPFAKLVTPVPATAAELMATPDHMLAWLRGKHPSEVITDDIGDCFTCLGATFLRERGFRNVRWYCTYGTVDGERVRNCDEIQNAISHLHLMRNGNVRVTAAEAIVALSVDPYSDRRSALVS